MPARLREAVRRQAGRHGEPRVWYLDSRSTKTAHQGGERGFDAGKKKVLTRKRHLLVNSLGLMLQAVVHRGDVQDRDGARLVLAAVTWNFARLHSIWADGAYPGSLANWVPNAIGDFETGRPAALPAAAQTLDH